MKKISRIVQLLPCHSLSGFPLKLDQSKSQNVLSSWTAAWHPSLLSSAQQIPIWCNHHQFTNWIATSDASDPEDGSYPHFSQYDDLHDEYDGYHEEPSDESGAPFAIEKLNLNSINDFWNEAVVFVPLPLECQIDDTFLQTIQRHAAIAFTGSSDRSDIIAKLNQHLALDQAHGLQATELIGDFFALGYAYLQTLLLTQKLRYSSSLPQADFETSAVAAANAFEKKQWITCDQQIGRCYDLLLEEKNSYYPVAPVLLDTVITTPQTTGPALQSSIELDHDVNFLMSGLAIDSLSDQPPVAERLKDRIAAGTAAVIGGTQHELPDPLLASETTIDELTACKHTASQILGTEIKIYLRHRFGLMRNLPDLLDQFEFAGAIHASLSGGKFPAGTLGTIRWAGFSDQSVLASTETILDANAPASFLSFSFKFGQQIDSAHQATMPIFHWPDRTCEAFEDLQRIARRSSLLGQFRTYPGYFDSIYDPGYSDHFDADEYAAPYLKQAVQEKSNAPISTTVDYWRRFYALHWVTCLIAQLRLQASTDDRSLTATLTELSGVASQLFSKSNSATATWNHTAENDILDTSIDELIERIVDVTKTCMTNPAAITNHSQNHLTILNPLNFGRRIFIETTLPQENSTATSSNHQLFFKSSMPYQIGHRPAASQLQCIADVAGSGQTQITLAPSDGSNATILKAINSEPSVLNGHSLRNEYFEASIDPKSGALKGIFFHGKRGNRGGQRLAYRSPDSREATEMKCLNITSRELSRVAAEITTSGQLIHAGQVVANFEQTFRLVRGQRVLDIQVLLEPKIELPDDERTYFALRTAWRDQGCSIRAASQQIRHTVNSPTIQSPNFIEITNTDYRLTLFPAGLPYHRRTDRTKLETILITGREHRRRFQLGLGINVGHSMKSAVDFLSPRVAVWTPANPQPAPAVQFSPSTLWMTWIEPITNSNQQVVGFHARLQETEGKPGEVKLTTGRAIESVKRVNFLGRPVQTIDDDRFENDYAVQIPFASCDFFQIEVIFAEDDPA